MALELGDVSIRCLLDSVNQISIWATRVLGLQMLRSIEQVKRRSLMIAALEVLAAALFSIAAGYYLVRRLKH